VTEPVASRGRFAWIQRLVARWRGESVPPSLPPAAEDEEAEAGSLEPTAPLDLAGLEKQVSKLGREQFKLNALFEKQQAQVQAALDQLRAQDARREQERADWLARRPAEQAEARLLVAQRLLPVLDGLDEAIASGERLLERAPSPRVIQAMDRRTSDRAPWWANVLAAPAVLARLTSQAKPSERERQRQALRAFAADMAAWQDAYAAWLQGLELVRERLFETLAMEGVEPLEAMGQPFDPHLHVALDTVRARDDAPSGTVVSELRRGYAVGDRVLRYAEVVVARAESQDLAGLQDLSGLSPEENS
jgi:molecular chaperone GrpE (heat shock protein)